MRVLTRMAPMSRTVLFTAITEEKKSNEWPNDSIGR